MNGDVGTARSGLARFLAIVACTFAGAIVCTQWAMVLLVLAGRPDASSGEHVPAGVFARVAWAIVRPGTWAMGGELGLFYVFPALACLWNRCLVPAFGFVLVVALAATTWGMRSGVPDALAMTIVVTAAALALVRFVPLRAWSVRPSVA